MQTIMTHTTCAGFGSSLFLYALREFFCVSNRLAVFSYQRGFKWRKIHILISENLQLRLRVVICQGLGWHFTPTSYRITSKCSCRFTPHHCPTSFATPHRTVCFHSSIHSEDVSFCHTHIHLIKWLWPMMANIYLDVPHVALFLIAPPTCVCTARFLCSHHTMWGVTPRATVVTIAS